MTSQTKATQQLLIEKFEQFLENTLNDEPTLSSYRQEWRTLKDMMQSSPTDFEKMVKFISQIKTAISINKTVSMEAKESIKTSNSIFTNPATGNMMRTETTESSPSKNQNKSKPESQEQNFKSKTQLTGSYLEPEQKTLVLNNLYTLRGRMQANSDSLIKSVQKQSFSVIKTENKSVLQGCLSPAKDENNVADLLRELDEKLAVLKIAANSLIN